MNPSAIDNDQDERRPRYKIIVLGKSTVGKTKLLTRFFHGFYEDMGITTISVDSTAIKRKNALYDYYDTAGQQRYASIVDMYYKGADACIIAYDVSSTASFQSIPEYYNKVKSLTEDALIYLVGCKADTKIEVTREKVAKSYKEIKNFQTSAKQNTNVNELFTEVEADLLQLKKGKCNDKQPRITALQYQNSGVNNNNNQNKVCCKN